MKDLNKVSSKQIRAIIVTTIIGIGILTLPNTLSLTMGNDGWIPIILGGLLTIPFIIIINKIFQLYPDKDFFQIGREVLGKWVFNLFLIIFLGHFIMLSAIAARTLGEIIRSFLLLTTPTEIIIIAFIIATSYIARQDIHIISRAGYHIYPITIGFIILLALIILPGIDFTNMLPVFQSDFTQLPKSVGITFLSYAGYEILLFVLPFAEEKHKALRSSIIGISVVILAYMIIFVISVSQFGVKHLQRQTYPTIALAKEVSLPGLFIENLDGVIVAAWVLIIFASMAAYYYASGKILSNLFRTRSQELFILPLLPIIYIISLIPENHVELNNAMGRVINYFSVFSIIIMPILIYSIGYYKTRRKIK